MLLPSLTSTRSPTTGAAALVLPLFSFGRLTLFADVASFSGHLSALCDGSLQSFVFDEGLSRTWGLAFDESRCAAEEDSMRQRFLEEADVRGGSVN